jgi:hypothetical protein
MKNCFKIFVSITKLVLVASLFYSSVTDSLAQVVLKVVNGSTSIDFTVNSLKSGKLYYLVSKVDLNTSNSTLIRDFAISATNTNMPKNGLMQFSLNDLGRLQTRLVSNLPASPNYFLYCVFENATSGLELVEKFTLQMPSRQPEISFISSVTGQIGAKSRYLLYRPEESYKKPNQAQPLLLFFHGDGEKGTDINLVKRNGPPRLINEGKDLDFIVVSPQISWPIYWDRPGYLEELIERIKATQNIDTNRIYITGISGGGGGIYYYTGNYASKVAAMVPVSAVNTLKVSCSIKDIAFWGFHNQNDGTVGVGNLGGIVNGINACNPKALVAPKTTIYPTSGHDGWTVTYNNSQLYAWLLTKTKNDKLNTSPFVNAGADQVVTSSVVLDGLATDNGFIVKYLWEKISGPEVTIIDQDKAKAVIKDLVKGTYIFKLTAVDNSGASVSDLITISANPTNQNNLPLVNAGNDILAISTISSLNLVGSAQDIGGTIISTNWTKISGPSVNILNSSGLVSTITNVLTGNYVFRFSATDNAGATVFDDLNMTIIPPVINKVPLVSAGNDIYEISTISSINLIGTASDLDGTIASTNWTKISGPPITISNSGSLVSTLTNVLTGNYVFRFSATDNAGATVFDDLHVSIVAPPVISETKGNGLSASYFTNMNLTGAPSLTRVDTTLNFDWGQSSPLNGIPIDRFSARWSGRIKSPITGSILFSTTSDDGVRLWINNVLVINNWTSHSSTINDATVSLVADEFYDIKLEYYDTYSASIIKLFWSFLGQPKVIIPKSKLYTNDPVYRLENEEVFKTESREWTIYPNPVSHELHIQIPEVEGIVKLSLINATGYKVYSNDYISDQSLISLDVNNYPSGVYSLEIRTDTEVIMKRIIIE